MSRRCEGRTIARVFPHGMLEKVMLAGVTADEVDKLTRLADRADVLACDVDALQSTIFARLLTYETGDSW